MTSIAGAFLGAPASAPGDPFYIQDFMRPNSNWPQDTYYTIPYPTHGWSNTGIGDFSADHYTPLILPRSITIDRLSIFYAAGASPGGVARIGLYNANQTTLRPTTLIVDCGEFSTNGLVGLAGPFTVNISLTAGLVYFFAFAQGGGSNGTINAVAATSPAQLQTAPFLGIRDGSQGRLAWKVTRAYAAFLSDVSAATFESFAIAPIGLIRVASIP